MEREKERDGEGWRGKEIKIDHEGDKNGDKDGETVRGRENDIGISQLEIKAGIVLTSASDWSYLFIFRKGNKSTTTTRLFSSSSSSSSSSFFFSCRQPPPKL
jgi:hypothetical protein